MRKLVDLTDGWNHEIHLAIEEKVLAWHLQMFPPREDDDLEKRDQRVSEMRTFYYARMTSTANLLVAGAAFMVSLSAFVVAVISLHH